MGISISEFKANVQDLARPNRFLLTFRGANAGLFLPEYQYLVKSTTMPGRTIGSLNVNWQGMQVKLAGDPSFDDITLSFHNDYNYNLRTYFERWLDIIAQMATNNRTTHAQYKAEVQMDQLGRTADEIKATYILEGAYPTSISTIDLSMDSVDSTEDFSVTFRFDLYYREDAPGAGILPRP